MVIPFFDLCAHAFSLKGKGLTGTLTFKKAHIFKWTLYVLACPFRGAAPTAAEPPGALVPLPPTPCLMAGTPLFPRAGFGLPSWGGRACSGPSGSVLPLHGAEQDAGQLGQRCTDCPEGLVWVT